MSDVHAYDDLGELYDVWCAEVVEDLAFYEQLVRAVQAERGAGVVRVVELGAGSGRVTERLLRAGATVTAIELSASQLARLSERCASSAQQLRVVQGDMRELGRWVEPGSVDVVVAPFRALLHVTAYRDALFGAVRDVLAPGGAFAFDVFHPGAEQIASTDGAWITRRDEPMAPGAWRFQERARYDVDAATEPGGIALDVDVRCRWRAAGRLRVRGAGSDAQRERRATLHLQLVTADRWRASLHAAGFAIDGEYGWFDARPLTPHDDDSIWVARRPAVAT